MRLMLSAVSAICLATTGCQTVSQDVIREAAEEKAKKHSNVPITVTGRGTSLGESTMDELQLSADLSKWGRRVSNAWALWLAAKLLAGIKEEPLPEVPKEVKLLDKIEVPPKKPQYQSSDSLFAEAKAMAGADQVMLDAMAAASKNEIKARGSVGGAKWLVDVAQPMSETMYTIPFKGDEPAEVLLTGDGDTNLELLVYDDRNGDIGNKIAQHANATDSCRVFWVPERTGKFHIVVKNPGRNSNGFLLRTN